MKSIKKPVSILLIMTMIVSLFTIIPFEASAASGVQYIERSWDDANKAVVDTEKTCTSYTLLANRSSDTLYSGWYVVDRDMTVNGRLRVSGTVNLILCDHKTLTLKSGITVLKTTPSISLGSRILMRRARSTRIRRTIMTILK